MPTFCRCVITLQKVHDSEDINLADVAIIFILPDRGQHQIVSHWLHWFKKICILEDHKEAYPVCNLRVTLCNIGDHSAIIVRRGS